jgi:hypothetical protein
MKTQKEQDFKKWLVNNETGKLIHKDSYNLGKTQALADEIEFLESLDDKDTIYKIPTWARADINRRLAKLQEQKDDGGSK